MRTGGGSDRACQGIRSRHTGRAGAAGGDRRLTRTRVLASARLCSLAQLRHARPAGAALALQQGVTGRAEPSPHSTKDQTTRTSK